MVDAYATSTEMRSAIRSSAAKVLALDLTAEYGTKFDDKEVYRLVKAHHLAELLAAPTRKTLDRLCWDATRPLTRWVREHEEEYTLAFQVDVGVKDDNGSTMRTVDAAPLLAEVIEDLAASPKSAATVRKILDDREDKALKAELRGLTEKQQKKVAASRAMAERIAGRKERTAMFDSFAERIVKLGMTPEEVTAELYRAEILQGATAEFNPGAILEMSPEEATLLGRLLVQGKAHDLIKALDDILHPVIVEVENNTQPSKGVGDIIGRTVHEALAPAA